MRFLPPTQSYIIQSDIIQSDRTQSDRTQSDSLLPRVDTLERSPSQGSHQQGCVVDRDIQLHRSGGLQSRHSTKTPQHLFPFTILN